VHFSGRQEAIEGDGKSYHHWLQCALQGYYQIAPHLDWLINHEEEINGQQLPECTGLQGRLSEKFSRKL
jgi:hypothetical protein